MSTMVNGFYVVLDRFVKLGPQVGSSLAPDVTIREMNPAHVHEIGKQALDLDVMSEAPAEIRHVLAVGFPENMKYHKDDIISARYKVAMPHIEALCPLGRYPDGRFQVLFKPETPAPDVSFSGMSGGPLFWSTETDYGILGIACEGGLCTEYPGYVYILGELATPGVIKGWIDECPVLSF